MKAKHILLTSLAVIISRTLTVKNGPYPQQMRAVRISLDQIFRGVEGGEVEVLTGFGGGDCGCGFKQAQQYLVYAYRSDDGQLRTSICTRTKSISEADDDLAYIEQDGKHLYSNAAYVTVNSSL